MRLSSLRNLKTKAKDPKYYTVAVNNLTSESTLPCPMILIDVIVRQTCSYDFDCTNSGTNLEHSDLNKSKYSRLGEKFFFRV